MGEVDDAIIPIIDISHIINSFPNNTNADPKMEDLVKEIRWACAKWGVFQVVNHGVPLEASVNLERASEEFFGQSKEDKLKVNRCVTNPLGYANDEHKQGFAFAYEYGGVHESTLDFVSLDGPTSLQHRNQWPLYPPHFRNVVEAYGAEVVKLGMKLLELIAISLKLPANRLRELHQQDNPPVFGRLSRYIVCPSPQLAIGFAPHTDSVGLTILRQDDVGELQVKRRSDGEWITVKPVSNAFVVNIGDLLQVWTNDKYESVEHRVVLNSEKERKTIAFVFGPTYDANVKPLEELVDQQNPPNYKEFKYGAFRASIQKGNIIGSKISHFKIT